MTSLAWLADASRAALRGRAARLAAAVLVGAALLAAWAPLAASDLPWRLRGRFIGEAEASIELLEPLAGELEAAPAAFAGRDSARIAAANAALELRLGLLARGLGAPGRAAVERWRARPEPSVSELARELAALEVPLRTRWPLAERLSAGDGALAGLAAALALLWLPALAIGAGPRRDRRDRRDRGARRRLALAALAAACGAALPSLARSAVGPALPLVDVKGSIAGGAIEVAGATWAPIPFGFAEVHAEESFRAPSWMPAFAAPGAAVTAAEVRPGEPGASAWNRHLLGTDGLGRDLLARTLWGARASLAIGALAAAILLALGTALGFLAAWLGGATERLLLRAIDVVQSFPSLVLVLIAAAWCSPLGSSTEGATALVLGLTAWPGVARLARAECARLRAADWALVARSQGLSAARIALAHVLPNALPPLLVQGVAALSWALVAEASLSFLGFGVRAPRASWGAILSETRQLEHWWCLTFPGLVLFACTLAASVLGEALRRSLDPRQGAGALARAEAAP